MLGRWLSPDPAGVGWNQYAYTTNPNSFIDPIGLAAGGCMAAPHFGTGPHANVGGTITSCTGGGSGDGGCSIDGGVAVSCGSGLVGSSGSGGEAGVPCPSNSCNGYVNGQYFEFIAGAGGAQGYVTENDISQGLYEIDGNFYTPQQLQAYFAQVYASQIDSQYDRTSNNAYLVFGDSASVDPNDPTVIGGHANFDFTCDDLTVCGPGRYDFGIHVEYDSNGNLVIHDDTVSPWISPASFSFSSLFSDNFWEHGFVDLVWGTLCNCVFPQ
jgi:hypothetical protein